jgi:hypothetical protein
MVTTIRRVTLLEISSPITLNPRITTITVVAVPTVIPQHSNIINNHIPIIPTMIIEV